MSERVAGYGLAAEAAHDAGLSGRLEGTVQLLTLTVEQGSGGGRGNGSQSDFRESSTLVASLKY